MRLIQRSTRRFAVTTIGQAYYQRCVAMLVEAKAAQELVTNTQSAPRGIVRLACPSALLVDHQTGLLSLVRDIDPDQFKNNVPGLTDMAEYFKLPTILTTSFEKVPNGPLVPELKAKFPTAPYIARPGQINTGLRQGHRQEAADRGRCGDRSVCLLPPCCRHWKKAATCL